MKLLLMTFLILVTNLYSSNHAPVIDENLIALKIDKLVANDTNASDYFGRSIAISGSLAVVGAYGNDDNGSRSGSAYIFTKEINGSWTQTGKLIALDANSSDSFGSTVAISGERVIIGASRNEDNGSKSGSAYIFAKDENGTWTQIAKLLASNAAEDQEFGISVSISDDVAIVGSNGDGDYEGAAYIFTRDENGSWNETVHLETSEEDGFGNSVAISGNIAVIGAIKDDLGDDNDSYTGSSYIFTRDENGSWNETVKLVASDATESDCFGNSVAIDKEIVIVGAYGNDDNGSLSGSAYIFTPDENGTWVEQNKLTASDADENDIFGFTVDISGNTVIIGAYGDNSNSGASYIFSKNIDGNWIERSKILAVDTEDTDYFGSNVAIGGAYLLIGAFADNSYSGSVYSYFLKQNISIDENRIEVKILNISDEDNDTITYDLSGNDASLFTIDENAELQFNDAPDYANPEDNNSDNIYEVKVTATDEDNDSSNITFSITVVDVFEDEDNDSMEDDWEILHFGNLDQNETTDADGDLLLDKDEYRYNTNPNSVDSDGDNLSDYHEVTIVFTDPNMSDTDGDGKSDYYSDEDNDYLNNGDEVTIYGTNPRNSDTDGDTLTDLHEIRTSLTDPNNADPDNDDLNDSIEVEIGTDPFNPDTDYDTLSDGDEYYIHLTDPKKMDTDNDNLRDDIEIFLLETNATNADTDGDGLNDGDELVTHWTDPKNADTDGEGLTDGEEINDYFTNPNMIDTDEDELSDADEVNTYGTNPNNADTDGDSLNDKYELEENPYITNPNNADTDGDGLDDGYELNENPYETNPLDRDTDEDNLTDYVEIYITNTNPTVKDSDENGINDGDEDSDGDGVSDIDEINMGRNPIISDNHKPFIDESLSVVEMNKLLTSDANSYDSFGESVAISGDIAIVGAYGDDDNGTRSGSAYIYEKEINGAWIQTTKLLASDASEYDYFGRSVAINDGTIIVGAYQDNDSRGSAYIFEKDETGVWIETTKIVAPDADTSDYFGNSVGISGNIVIVGAYGDDEGSTETGSAYIFQKASDGSWTYMSKLRAIDYFQYDYFGSSVAISEGIAIIGAYGNDDNGSQSGSAYIFTRESNGSWGEASKLLASDANESDYFASSVAISGNRAVIGAYGDNNSSGSAYIFTRDVNGSWTEISKLTSPDAEHNDYFGSSVAINGDHVIVGSYGDDDNGSSSGSAYVYFINTDGTVVLFNKSIASDANSNDYFGRSVSIGDTHIIVGAYGDDDDGSASGSAYTYLMKQDLEINENSTDIKTLNISDEDNDTINYTLSGNDALLFSIGTHAELAFNPAQDYENPNDYNRDDVYEVKVTATDEYNGSNSITLHVKVLDIFEDEDNDTMDDNWEMLYFGNLDQNETTDADGDLLLDIEEYTYETNPTDTDTDADGLTDKEEISTYNTNPNNPDSDGDGLSDGEEVNTYHTDPNNADTDDDGVSDGEEVANGTDPLKKGINIVPIITYLLN